MSPSFNMIVKILLLLLTTLAVAFPNPPPMNGTESVTSNTTGIIYPEPWDGAQCYATIYVEQRCRNGGQGSKSHIQTYARFVIFDNSWRNIEGLTGDIGYPNLVDVHSVPDGVGQIWGPFGFYFRWKMYIESHKGKSMDKMTFHAPRDDYPRNDEDIACNDKDWSVPSGDTSNPGFYDFCFKYEKWNNKGRVRTAFIFPSGLPDADIVQKRENTCNFSCYPRCGDRKCNVVPPW